MRLRFFPRQPCRLEISGAHKAPASAASISPLLTDDLALGTYWRFGAHLRSARGWSSCWLHSGGDFVVERYTHSDLFLTHSKGNTSQNAPSPAKSTVKKRQVAPASPANISLFLVPEFGIEEERFRLGFTSAWLWEGFRCGRANALKPFLNAILVRLPY